MNIDLFHKVRSTRDGRLSIAFTVNHFVPTGYVTRIDGRVPCFGMELKEAPIQLIRPTGSDYVFTAQDVSVVRAKVIVWRFPSASALKEHDLAKAELVGSASNTRSFGLLLPGLDHLGFQEASSGLWLSLQMAHRKVQ